MAFDWEQASSVIVSTKKHLGELANVFMQNLSNCASQGPDNQNWSVRFWVGPKSQQDSLDSLTFTVPWWFIEYLLPQFILLNFNLVVIILEAILTPLCPLRISSSSWCIIKLVTLLQYHSCKYRKALWRQQIFYRLWIHIKSP